MASVSPGNFVLALLFSTVFSGISFRLKFLSVSGAVAATILGMVILGLGGWSRVFPLLAFFISSSVLSRLRDRAGGEIIEARGSRRDAVQILANGGVAGAVTLLHWLCGSNLYPAYLGALAASTADTWSTEIGILGGGKPRLITNWRRVPPGTSGGVSAPGFVGAFVGALLIAVVGWLSAPTAVTYWLGISVITAGFGGSVFDSFLGASVQQRRRCRICSKITEKKIHCQTVTEIMGGWRWLNNDGVNFLCSVFGALISVLLIG